jgi:hypothetical protein
LLLVAVSAPPKQQPAFIMALDSLSSLAQVLAVAKIHPFYTRDVVYPPDAETVKVARDQAAAAPINADCIRDQPLLFREDL